MLRAPALSALTERHPKLQVRLELFDRLVDVAAEGFDLDVRVGDEIAPHLIARRLADNHRVLCAAPSYVAQRGMPRTLDDLKGHDCVAIKERDHPFGVWRLQCDGRELTVKVSGPLSSNNGEVALRWALDGRGIVLRSMWQVASLLVDGKLVQASLTGGSRPTYGRCIQYGWSARRSCALQWNFWCSGSSLRRHLRTCHRQRYGK